MKELMNLKQLYGKNEKPYGKSPGIILENPKFSHNVGAALRAASCFGVNQLIFTGNRVSLDSGKGKRLPREERMKGYDKVELVNFDYPFDMFDKDVIPIAVEIDPAAESLVFFEHPENAVYVFGPEDGSISSTFKRHCYRFIIIPTFHCVNLAAAVYITLYDRALKSYQEKGNVPASYDILNEQRGYEFDLETL